MNPPEEALLFGSWIGRHRFGRWTVLPHWMDTRTFFTINTIGPLLLPRGRGVGLILRKMRAEGKFYKAKPKRNSRTFWFWFAITRPNRVFQSQKVAQNAPLLPYFLEHEENLGSEKSLFEPFSWPTEQMNHQQHLKNAPHFLAIVRPVTIRPSGPSQHLIIRNQSEANAEPKWSQCETKVKPMWSQ